MRRNLSLIILVIFLASCGTSGPQPGTPASTDAVRAFYVGLAALDAGDDVRAKTELTKATELASNEPAAWANLGILQMRHRDYDASANSLERARSLADKNPQIYETIALLEKQRGNFDASQANLQKAIDLDANNVKAIYALAKEKERQTDDAAARELYGRILRIRPNNLEVQLDALRLAAKQNDTATVGQIAAEIERMQRTWETEVRTQFDALRSAIAADEPRAVVTQAAFLRNTLLRDPGFRASVDEVKYSDTTVGEPFIKPLTLQVPNASPAPPDLGLSFEQGSQGEANAEWSKSVYLNGDGNPLIASGDRTGTRVRDQSIPVVIETAAGLAPFDFDYDFGNDLAFAGLSGFKLYRQTESGLTDVTGQTRLPGTILNGRWSGVWTFDFESDGDLDLILGSVNGPPTVLQNNSDGTFSSLKAFEKVNAVVQFASADLDEDGDADVVMLDANGVLHIFSNERGGLYSERKLPDDIGRSASFSIGDANSDGKLDLVVVQFDGRVRRIADKDSGLDWEVAELFSIEDAPSGAAIMLSDLDNNGASDIIIRREAQTELWLGSGIGEFSKLSSLPTTVTSVADLNNDGRVDLVRRAGTLINQGTKNYNWQTIRPRAAKTTGDQRVNSFGIGGELELRSGLLLQKRLITEPVVHFGLGENPGADVLRVIWQNGYVQAEFDLKPNQTIAAEQRLKGSCPHLFAYDGESFKLVKDAPPWSPALGLKINAQDIFGVLSTEEWFKIPGEAIKPTKENFYELRITGEYWESFYLDHYSLLVVDHPDGTEVFADERFAIPPAPLEVFTTGQTREFASAKNDKGEDVSAIVRTLDEKYLDGFERGTFQGVAKDHYVELELPVDAPAHKSLTIVADGWVHPTDASINVQLGQSSNEKPRSLSLETRDARGEWRVAKENLGFPAGKMKTVLIQLPLGTRAARLRTNMEIFWDKLAWAVYEDGGQNKTTRLELATSDLRFRGFSVIEKADDSSPEKPVYDRLLTTNQRWRDMEGYFTRFGDVRELLAATDNRFVLMNAGDELVLKFAALPPPPAGYKRDFVLIGNGWIKDGDLNSVSSKTLIPLPTHTSNDYSRPPTTLENDPVYQQHRSDWLNFHTRYVSPDRFQKALR